MVVSVDNVIKSNVFIQHISNYMTVLAADCICIQE